MYVRIRGGLVTLITIKRYGGFKDGRLQRFGNKVKKGMPVTLRDVANHVRDNAKNIVAVKTGRLQRSIRVMKTTGNTVFVGTSVPYSMLIEYGTVNMSAQPYFRPAIEMTAKLTGKTVSVRMVNAWRGS